MIQPHDRIGNYVHFSYSKYLKYGLQRKSTKENANIDIGKIIEEQKNIINKQVHKKAEKYNDSQIKLLEEKLNYFYAWGKISDIEDERRQAYDAIIEMAKKALEEKLKGKNINFKNLSIGSKQYDFSELIELFNKSQDDTIRNLKTLKIASSKKDGKYNTAAAVEKRLALLQQIYNRIPTSLEGKLSGFMKEIEALQNSWADIQQTSSSRRLKSGIQENFLKQLNSTIYQIKLSDDALKGELSELVQYAMEYIYKKGLTKGLEDLEQDFGKVIIDEFKKSKKESRSKKGLSIDFIDKNIIGFDLNKVKGKDTKYNLNEDLGLFTIHSTEDKIDLNIDVGNEMFAPISLKNYNLDKKSHLTLLTGRSLVGLVQEYGLFVNHYLNIVPDRKEDDAPSIDKKKMQDIMKLTIALKALAGGVQSLTGRTKEADFFVVNDSSARQPEFKVYSIKKIISNAEQDIDATISIGGGFNKGLTNKWIGKTPDWKDANARIRDLISQMHQMQLKVSINKSVLK